jgi:hypothetical protein
VAIDGSDWPEERNTRIKRGEKKVKRGMSGVEGWRGRDGI